MARADYTVTPCGSRLALAACALFCTLGLHAEVAASVTDPPHARPGPYFYDATGATGLHFLHDNGGTARLALPEAVGSGVALFDYDNDGDLDLYLGQGGALTAPNIAVRDCRRGDACPSDRLFRNDLSIGEDGDSVLRFTDVTEAAGLSASTHNMGVATADIDNDGWIDLYLTNIGANQLWHNNGDGTFTDVTARSRTDDRRFSVAASLFDYDRDGWLDLFIGNYVDYWADPEQSCFSATGAHDYCGPLSYRPEPNRLLRNSGDGVFEAASAGIGTGSAGATLGSITADLDGSGLLDLYVANDKMANRMWINQGDGTFVDEALLAGTAVDESGLAQASMGVAAGDFDGDGDEDLFLTHLAGEMNTLYRNDGTGLFVDVSSASGLGAPSWSFTGFGLGTLDVDNDGHTDFYIANGAVKRIDEQVRAGIAHPLRQEDLLLFGRSGGHFERAAGPITVAGSDPEVGRGVAVGDLDNDGDADLVITNNRGPARVLVNQVGQKARWLGFRLLMPELRRDAIGALVVLERADAPPLSARVRTDGSFVSARDPRVLFGLGSRAEPNSITSLRVVWPDGSVEEWPPAALEIDAYNVLQQGTGSRPNRAEPAPTP